MNRLSLANQRPLLSLLVLSIAALACQINVGGPETPEARVPVSTEAIESLAGLWESALARATESGQLTLVVTEAQLTSLLALRMQQMEAPLFEDPQVLLREGQIEIYGRAHRGLLTANTRIVLDVLVDDSGTPRLELSSADFGPWPVPDELLTGLSAMLDEAFTGRIGPAATGLRVESITIGGGLMAITGQIK